MIKPRRHEPSRRLPISQTLEAKCIVNDTFFRSDASINPVFKSIVVDQPASLVSDANGLQGEKDGHILSIKISP